MDKFTKWVACWGTATSITDRNECVYAKDITLRYPIKLCFSGNSLRLHFSNLTGTEPVELTNVYVLRTDKKLAAFLDEREKVAVATLEGNPTIVIEPGEEVVTDEIVFKNANDMNDKLEFVAGETIEISIYLKNATQMNAGTLVTGPLSGGKYSYGNHALDENPPAEVTRSTNWYYFLNTIDIFTEEKNHALICYGDSITAQSWPDYLAIRAFVQGYRDISIIRRAVCGTRILRQYDCITYQAYGLKGETRFPLETEVAGATGVIIQHGINDIIHPVGEEVNMWRPWSDLPTLEEMTEGVTKLYINHAKEKGLKVYGGTLLPIYGWRTYEEFRDELRVGFNEWIRTSSLFDGVVDFDKAVRNEEFPKAFREGFDSGDHLHPSETAYEAMAEAVPVELLK